MTDLLLALIVTILIAPRVWPIFRTPLKHALNRRRNRRIG